MTNIEKTPEAHRRFDALTAQVCPAVDGSDESPYARTLREQQERQIRELEVTTKLMMTRIVQQIIGEDPNENVFLRATEIEEENGLPFGVSAEDIYDHFMKTYRP
jgi:hypothetical protein